MIKPHAKLLPVLSLIFLTASVFAQPGSQSLTFGGGIAFPTRDYGFNWGKARPGAMAGLTYSYQFPNSDWAIVIEIRGKNNPVDLNYFTRYHGDAYTSTKPNYRMAALLFGAGYRTGFGKRWSIEEQVLIGYGKYHLDQSYQTVFVKSAVTPVFDGNFYLSSELKELDAFTGAIKIGPVFRISKRIEVVVKADYWITFASSIVHGIYSGQVGGRMEGHLGVAPATIDLVTGIRYRF